MQKKNKI